MHTCTAQVASRQKQPSKYRRPILAQGWCVLAQWTPSSVRGQNGQFPALCRGRASSDASVGLGGSPGGPPPCGHPQALRLFWHARGRSAWLAALLSWALGVADAVEGEVFSAVRQLCRGKLLPLDLASLATTPSGTPPATLLALGLFASGRHVSPTLCRLVSAGFAFLVCPWGGWGAG
jgi:hypothetical protein